jgi:nucleoside-diphosphate-sugar epimerase
MMSGDRPQIFGDGEQSRDFTYVANVVEANLRAVEAPDEALGEVFNIACGERTTVNTLVREISELIGVSVLPFYTDPRPGDILHSCADIEKARRMLWFEPLIGFKQGLRKTTGWYRERR